MADLNLIYLGLVIPVANLSFFAFLPSFDVTKRNWAAFFAFLSSAGSGAADLPVLHSLVQWVLSAPAFLILGFSRACRLAEQAPQQHAPGRDQCLDQDISAGGTHELCHSASALMVYLCTQGLLLLAVQPISALITSIGK